MNAYIYQAALWCGSCTTETMRHLVHLGKAPFSLEDETSYDFDDWPKGPYPDGGGESDSPQHCAGCGVFLENDLTHDGVEWVVFELLDYLAYNTGSVEVLDEWAVHIERYGLERYESAILACFKQVREEQEIKGEQ